jgi:hypothetical protein
MNDARSVAVTDAKNGSRLGGLEWADDESRNSPEKSCLIC